MYSYNSVVISRSDITRLMRKIPGETIRAELGQEGEEQEARRSGGEGAGDQEGKGQEIRRPGGGGAGDQEAKRGRGRRSGGQQGEGQEIRRGRD